MEDFSDDAAGVEQSELRFKRAKPGKGRRIIKRILYGVSLVAALLAMIAFFSVGGRADSAPPTGGGICGSDRDGCYSLRVSSCV